MHPHVQTYLRCVRCGAPICPSCLEHSPEGALCPRCVHRGPAVLSRAPGFLRLMLGAAAGVILCGTGSALLALFPFGAVLILPFLLLGLLTGEVIAAVAGRPGGPLIGMVGLMSGLLAPVAGRAIATSIVTGAGAAGLTLTANADFSNGLSLLLVLGSASIAGVRAATSRG